MDPTTKATLESAGLMVSLVLNVASITGLVVQDRRARRTERIAAAAHKLAQEADEWSRAADER